MDEGFSCCTFVKVLCRWELLVLQHRPDNVDTRDNLINVVADHECFQFEWLSVLHDPKN